MATIWHTPAVGWHDMKDHWWQWVGFPEESAKLVYRRTDRK